MASSSLTLFCLFLSLISISSSSLNLRRPISSQSNGHDLLFSTLSSLNLDRPSLAADDIHDLLLPLYGFPKGLLPNNVKSYTLPDDGDFTVDLISRCYVDFPAQTVNYDKKISGKLSYGSVKDVEGIQAKEFLLWVPITAMESDPSSGTDLYSPSDSCPRLYLLRCSKIFLLARKCFMNPPKARTFEYSVFLLSILCFRRKSLKNNFMFLKFCQKEV